MSAELNSELLLCARYGELEELIAALDAGANVNHVDEGGSSALHMACANGHADVARTLLKRGAAFAANASGNTPLHWAVQNEHDAVVEVLLSTCDSALVLAKNQFGKSALTEAFGRGSAMMLSRLLEHQSARELEPENGALAASPATEDALDLPARIDVQVVHEFELGGALPDSARTGPASSSVDPAQGPGGTADVPIGQPQPQPVRVSVREIGGGGGTSRMRVSAAAIVLAQWLAENKSRFGAKNVCELGAGCGLPGLTLAVGAACGSVLLTDVKADDALDNLAHNLSLNSAVSQRDSTGDTGDVNVSHAGVTDSMTGTASGTPRATLGARVAELDWLQVRRDGIGEPGQQGGSAAAREELARLEGRLDVLLGAELLGGLAPVTDVTDGAARGAVAAEGMDARAAALLRAADALLADGGVLVHAGTGGEVLAAQARACGFGVEAHELSQTRLSQCCLVGEGGPEAFAALFAAPLRAVSRTVHVLIKLTSASRWERLPGWALAGSGMHSH